MWNEPCDDDVDVGFELEEARKAITLSIIEVLLVSLPWFMMVPKGFSIGSGPKWEWIESQNGSRDVPILREHSWYDMKDFPSMTFDGLQIYPYKHKTF